MGFARKKRKRGVLDVTYALASIQGEHCLTDYETVLGCTDQDVGVTVGSPANLCTPLSEPGLD